MSIGILAGPDFCSLNVFILRTGERRLLKTHDGYSVICIHYREFEFTTARQTVWPESFSALF